MFTPPEIPLSGYTPPQTDIYLPKSSTSATSNYPLQYDNFYTPTETYRLPADSYPQVDKQLCSTYKNLHPTQVYSSQGSIQNFTPKPFTPSPIAHEKLAVFEPNKTHQSQPSIIRRPLTIPNQVVQNVSPAPFGFCSTYDSYQNSSWQQSANPPQSNRLSGCSFASSSTNYNPLTSGVPLSAPKSPRTTFDLSHQENYNRAARGWGQDKDFYRPISFNKPYPIELPYTDF